MLELGCPGRCGLRKELCGQRFKIGKYLRMRVKVRRSGVIEHDESLHGLGPDSAFDFFSTFSVSRI